MRRRLRYKCGNSRRTGRAERGKQFNSRRLAEGKRVAAGNMNAAYTSAAHKLRPACGASANWKRLFDGILLGTAVGDALGLPAENLSPRRIKRLWKNEWRMRFVFGRGMISDDTEHTLMVAQAMLAHGDDVTDRKSTRLNSSHVSESRM